MLRFINTYSMQYWCRTKFVLVVEFHKISLTASTVIIIIVIVKTFTFFEHSIIFDCIKRVTDPTFLLRIHNCLLFHQTMPRRESVMPRSCPTKIGDTVCNRPSSCFKNNLFCRHRNCVISVVCSVVLHLCY